VGTIGTPNYMSPEQVNGDPVDRRSDIFAVGLVAYELFSYRMAFPGESGRVYDLIRYREPEPLSAFVTNCDPRLIALVQRAIAKRPADRYQQLDEMRADLAAIRKSHRLDDHKPLGDRVETVIEARPSTPQPNPLDRAALARRRQRIVEDHIAAGKVAFDAGDLEAAVDRFEQAAALDDLNPQALELLELARNRVVDREAQELLNQAEAQLSASHLNEASALVEQALALRGGDERAATVRAAIARARAIDDALALARKHLGNNAAEAALRAASEALGHDGLNTEALELTQRGVGIDRRSAASATASTRGARGGDARARVADRAALRCGRGRPDVGGAARRISGRSAEGRPAPVRRRAFGVESGRRSVRKGARGSRFQPS
jgi:tetratricopeptide (TPR) repeat protein